MRRTAWIAFAIALAMVSTVVPMVSRSLPIQYGHSWGTNGNEYVTAIEVDGAGNVYIAGVSYSVDSSDSHGFVAKLTPNGVLVWDMYLGQYGYDLTVSDMSFSTSGDIYLLGALDSNYGMPSTFYAKISKDGSLLYSKVLDSVTLPMRIATDAYSNGFLITAMASSSYDGVLVAVSDSGNVRWATGATYYPADVSSYGLVVDAAGYSYEFSDRTGGSDVGIEKFDAGGNLIKEKILRTPSYYEYSWDLAMGPDGNIYALGAAIDRGLLILIKFTPSLDVVWSELVGNLTMRQEAARLVLSEDGTLIAVGQAEDWTSSLAGPALFNFDTSGRLMGASFYGVGGNSTPSVMFTDAAACPGHGVMIAGACYGIPRVQEIPISNVTVSNLSNSWQDDNVIWSPFSASAQALPLSVTDPMATVDDFSTSANVQGWFGFLETKAAKLNVEISLRQHGANGERVALKAVASNGTPKYQYNWNFGDGGSASGQKVNHEYSAGGIYQASVRVTDAMGEYGLATIDVVVMGPPVILGIYSYPDPPTVDIQTIFYTLAIDPDGGAIVSYSWDFGDGTTVSTTNSTVDHKYTAVGTYNLTLTVFDDEGSSTSMSKTMNVVQNTNHAPYAYFFYYPWEPEVGQNVQFDGSQSSDPDGWIQSFQWDFGDGSNGSGPMAVHVYTMAGLYTAVLTVFDNLGASSSYQSQLTVQGPPPVTPDMYEPDDNFTEASTIAVGGSQTHSIGAGGSDVDWVRFTMNQTGDVVIGTSGPAGDTVLYLYNASGVPTNPMASDDNSGPGLWSQISCTLGPGTYYIKVMNASQNAEIASYTLQVKLAGAAAKWTFMVYEDGDNNLEEVALADFLEMSSVGSSPDINIVVLMDRTSNYSTAYGDWTDAKLFYVTQGMTPTAENAIADMGEVDMGLPTTLSDFVTWAMASYPADNYLLDMWDHGGGWDGAVCWDETNNWDALTLAELDQALNVSSMTTGSKLDIIGFDACLMGMTEVAYEIQDRADVLVFSEASVPWDGWPYDTVLTDLAADPSMGSAAFGSCIVNRYMEYYVNSSSETMSAINMAATAPVYQAVDSLADALMANMDMYRYAIAWARNATQSFDDPSYIDLYDFCSQLTGYVGNSSLMTDAQNVMDATTAATISSGHGNYLPNAHGLSIYFPTWGYSDAYSSLRFAVDLSWDDFLMAYSGVVPVVPDAYEPDDTYSQASPITLGEIQTHSICPQGDVDWVVFNLTQSETVVIRTFGPPNSYGDTVISLYDAWGVPYSPIATNDDYNGTWSLIRVNLGPGTYYVAVWPYGNGDQIPIYYLSVSEAAPDLPPVIQSVYCYPSNATPYQYVYFGVNAYDPDGYIDHFEWDFGDGGYTWTWSNTADHIYQAGGNYVVTVTAYDDMGSSASSTIIVHVMLPPVAIITMPDVVKVGTPATFSAADSFDPSGGTIMAYNWWFSDGYNGSSATGSEVTHVFASTGQYQVGLSVVSSTGLWGYNSSSFLVVNPHPPVAVVSYDPARPMVGGLVTFDGSHSVDPDGSLSTFIWEFGDGAVADGMTATHAYEHPGVYQVKLTVIDEDMLSDKDTTSITVVSQPIAAFEASPPQPSFDQPVTFSAYGSYDEVGITEYAWSFGDGYYAQGWQVSHQYVVPGHYQVTLTVKNTEGVTASLTKTVNVSSTPSSSSLSGPVPVQGGSLQGAPVYSAGTMELVVLLAALLLGGVLFVSAGRKVRRAKE